METYINLIPVVICVWLHLAWHFWDLSILLFNIFLLLRGIPLFGIPKFDYAFAIDGHLGCF